MESWGSTADNGDGLRSLFLQDVRTAGFAGPGRPCSGSAADKPEAPRAAANAGASSSASQSVGWGGLNIPSEQQSGPRWFGRSNRSKVHRQATAQGRGHARGPADLQTGGEQPCSQPSAFAGPAGRSAQEDVLSVEELVQHIKRLGRAEPLPERVFRALHHLDSRAVALLLKDLSKAALDGRSIELFDALRALPERHLLRPLCDVYTYTATISLCIYQQNVDRAMELLGEMRARGVERNVHTYTALMNVCIKCGKLTTALDIFHNMKAEGCTPNVVTYNTLIDVYGKLGQWDRAVNVLKLMRSEGVLPALRTFNTLIIACNMCNQPREALAVHAELRESGFEANSTTFNALISAYGKLGQLDRVLGVYKDMVWKGLERSVITYSSLISACEKAGHWETALQLFEEMTRDGCQPNTITYNSLITACGQGAQWERARQVFEQMQGNGCAPDVVTYTALISALERGRQWQLALDAFNQMVQRGCRPDAIVFNAIIDALWQTGVVWAQVKARELFAMAVKQGHFRNERLSPDGRRGELNLHALTAGVAMLSLHGWLADIQHKVATCGDSALPPLLAVVTDAGTASKEQGNFIIKEAVSTLMSFWGAPFRAVQDRTYLGVLEAPGPQLAAWVRSAAFSAQMASLFPGGTAAEQPPASCETLTQQQCGEAFGAVQRFEASHNLVLQNMGLAYLQQRTGLISGLLEKGAALGLKDEVVHDGVLLLDRTASAATQVSQEVLPLVACAALQLAMAQGASPDSPAPSAAQLAEVAGVEAQSLLDMSWRLQQLLHDDTLAISAMRCLKVYLERIGYRHLDRQGIYIMAGLPIMLAVEAMFDMSLLNCRPSIVAAALLYAERRHRGAVPFWPSTLAKMTGYEDLTTPELSCAVRAAQKLCRKVLYPQIYKQQCTNLAAQLQQQQQQQVVQMQGQMPSSSAAAAAPPVMGRVYSNGGAAAGMNSGMHSGLLVLSGMQLQQVPSLQQQQQQGAGVVVTAGVNAGNSSAGHPGQLVHAMSGGLGGLGVSVPSMMGTHGSIDYALLGQLELQQQQQQQQMMGSLPMASSLSGDLSAMLAASRQSSAHTPGLCSPAAAGSAFAASAGAAAAAAAAAGGGGGFGGVGVAEPAGLRDAGLESIAMSLSLLGINVPIDAASLDAALSR
ncbi:hypothetical protein OEZ86_012195 [Tetradesmus obliquus]|nr:hypothetical protein OEZ86_012195 [Tetradesmus obliquus]